MAANFSFHKWIIKGITGIEKVTLKIATYCVIINNGTTFLDLDSGFG